MSKQLLIVRHAKSDWNDASLSDFNRPLNVRGLKDAPIIGDKLLKNSFHPDLVISSTALRAISTCKLVCKQLGIDKSKIETNSNIYEASHQQLLKVINTIDNDFEKVAMFGHNNGVTDLTVYLTDADIFNIPTSGMVLISFPFDDWKMVSKGTGKVVLYEYPKNITED
ncbi:histidine phosphatase family protein [Pedobacter psychrophilus]|uniref:Histidine phosphatase family protein n=1 Tax=Pedobacter psychrophilus TaxID=1826909 RepID=A0A179DMK6_9SPHI|nr:histidine phosphatase family protein [Pedobacter psychrophilus]OAQ42154.1 histidine phosphatase family protein [Pedobacter psychrophilus]